MSKDQTKNPRVSFLMSPETVGPELHTHLMGKNKHARANEIQRLLMLGFVYERSLFSGNIAIHAPSTSASPAVQEGVKRSNGHSTAPVEIDGAHVDPGLGGDLMNIFSGGISLAG